MTRITEGTVFGLPLDELRSAVGQVLNVRLSSELLVVVFSGTAAHGDEMEVARSSPPALLGLTLDALFHHGRWPVVGVMEPRVDVERPTFKVALGTPGRFVEESVEGAVLRDLSPVEAASMPYRKTVAPIRIDKATKALHGLEPWEDRYNDLLPVQR
jgi:hypothetical protein